MPDRRNFPQGTLGPAAVAGLAPLSAEAVAQAYELSLPPLPDRTLYDKNADAYWAEMRNQFVIPPDHIYLNNGTVGSSPLPVLKSVFDSYFDCERLDWADPERYPIWGYEPWNEYRDPLADLLGVTRDELALLRNATEANNFMIRAFP